MIQHIFKLIWNKKGSNALMILEIFLSFLVLFAVLSYVFHNMGIINKPLGFDSQDRWQIYLDIPTQDSLARLTLKQQLHDDLLALDEVQSISHLDNIGPFNGNQWRTGTDHKGQPINTLIVPADEHLAEVMNIKVTEGRWFTEADKGATHKPILVNQTFMDKYFEGQSLIDSIINFSGERKVIGVFEDYRYQGEFSPSEPTVFKYTESYDPKFNNIMMHMQPNTPAVFEETIANLVNAQTKSTGSILVNIEKARKKNSQHSWLIMISLLSICGFLCINVALGLFGVLWYTINKRRAEIGLRQALGAHSSDVSKHFISEVLILAGIAILFGIFFAIQVPILKITPYPAAMFYKAIAAATLIILALVVLCALYPSIQAAKISPATALHED